MEGGFDPSDERLVSSTKDGNLDAFNSLVERYQAAVFTLCLRLLGDRQAAEDAAQEAFISGRIRLFGDQQKLLDCQPVFGALDSIFSSVRERTSYD